MGGGLGLASVVCGCALLPELVARLGWSMGSTMALVCGVERLAGVSKSQAQGLWQGHGLGLASGLSSDSTQVRNAGLASPWTSF